MDFLIDALTNWLKEMLVGGIMGNLSGMFNSVNQQVSDISGQIGQTPPGLEPGHLQHDSHALGKHHGSHCRCNPGDCYDRGADSDDCGPEQPA